MKGEWCFALLVDVACDARGVVDILFLWYTLLFGRTELSGLVVGMELLEGDVFL